MKIGSTCQTPPGLRLLVLSSSLALGALASPGAVASAETTAPAAAATAPAVASAATSPSAGGQPVPTTGPSATLEQCVTSSTQAERSATFLGEMTATAGTGRMSIRIELQERLAGEPAFRNVAAPGLGVWRAAAPGVKVYRYIKQVTNLSAPAVYRAAVRFRWLNTKGKLIRGIERRTPVCVQPAARATTPAAGV
ncbi:MAG TPA: hypothetical protein VNZ01_07445 [Solirubrobacteraceae bacterium]|jgi:hypothetical protein|nr:hypothetical protein [Solirubrobacteraceae bacterium]